MCYDMIQMHKLMRLSNSQVSFGSRHQHENETTVFWYSKWNCLSQMSERNLNAWHFLSIFSELLYKSEEWTNKAVYNYVKCRSSEFDNLPRNTIHFLCWCFSPSVSDIPWLCFAAYSKTWRSVAIRRTLFNSLSANYPHFASSVSNCIRAVACLLQVSL